MAALAAMVLFCTSAGVVVGQPKLVIDHDGGADDAMAIFEALIYEQYFNGPQVLALTTTHGNVPEDQAFINSQRFLDIANRRDVPIYRGSNFSLVVDEPSDGFFGRDGLGDAPQPVHPIPAQPGHAALAFIDMTKKYPGEIILVALGTMTNIALAIRLDPAFLSRLLRLYLGVGQEIQYPKFNVYQDVEAYHVTAQAARPDKVTLLYFEDAVNVTTEWRRNVLGRLPTKKIEALNTFERISLKSDEQKDIWNLLDPVVMTATLNECLVGEVKYSNNSVTLCGHQRGVLTNNYTTEQNANMKVIRHINANKYKTVLYSIFAVEAK